jgi:hypothetical protein
MGLRTVGHGKRAIFLCIFGSSRVRKPTPASTDGDFGPIRTGVALGSGATSADVPVTRRTLLIDRFAVSIASESLAETEVRYSAGL